MNPTRMAVYRPAATAVLALAVVVVGLVSLTRLPVDHLPDITYPLVKIHIWWQGATPDEIEDHVAEPLERQVASVEGLDYVESSILEGNYTLLANFEYGRDIDVACQDVQAAVSRAARELPADMDPPVVIKADPSQLPVLQLAASSTTMDPVTLRTWSEDWLRERLLAVRGVAGAEVAGGLEREIRVHLDPAALVRHDLPVSTVLRRLAQDNVERSAGRVFTARREHIARIMGEYDSLDAIRSLPLLWERSAPVSLDRVARVSDAHEEVRVLTRLDGRSAVRLDVIKQADANTVEVADAVSARLAALESAIPDEVELAFVENQAAYVRSALLGVVGSAGQALLLVIAVVYVFLGSRRPVGVMVLTLPVIFIGTFAVMAAAGFSLDTFSLGGLVIALGVLLDNSILVVENITRQHRERPDEPRGEVAVGATREVGVAIVASTTAFIALFIPFLFVSGLVSLLFRELILVIASAVLISLVVAVTLTPMLSAKLLDERNGSPSATAGRRSHKLQEGYARLVHRLLRRPRRVLGGAVLLFLAGVGLFATTGSEFLPDLDDGRVIVKAKLPAGAALTETDAVLRRVEDALEGDPSIASRFTLAGGKIWGLYISELANEGQVEVQLVPQSERDESTSAFIARVRPQLARLAPPGGKVMTRKGRIRGIKKMGESDIEVEVRGESEDVLSDLADRIATTMRDQPHLTNVDVSLDFSRPEIQVEVDRPRAAAMGLSMEQVAGAVQTLVGGTVATWLRDGAEQIPVRVRLPESAMRSRNAVEDLVLVAEAGVHARLGDLARVEPAVGPLEIVRVDQERMVAIRTDAKGVSKGSAVAELQDALSELDIPPGYEIAYGGQARLMSDMRQTVLAVLALSAFLAFVVLAVQFDSVRLPLLVLGSVPLSLVGVAAAIRITGLALGATVVIGALVVVAATISDGVLLYTSAETLRARGMAMREAIAQAARIRLRPRLMTTLTTAAGLFPLALGPGAGGELLRPMGVGATGGLVVELVVAMAVMPCLYVVFGRK